MKNAIIEPLESRIAPAVVSISAPAAAYEGDSGTHQVQFVVKLNAPATGPITVQYHTVDGTATTADNDYAAASGTVTFAMGDSMQTIPVSVNGDTNVEADEKFNVVLTAPTGATLGTSSATATILSDDPTISISGGGQLTAQPTGIQFATFTVALSAAPVADVTVQYASIDGTATAADGDFKATSGTLTWHVGDPLTQQVTVPIYPDTSYSGDEQFTVALSNPTNSALDANSTSTVTITDDAIGITVGNATVVRGSSGQTSAIFTVTLPKVPIVPIDINWSTVDGDAKGGAAGSGADYLALSNQDLTWAVGETTLTKTISVPVFGSPSVDLDEHFTVNLTNTANSKTVSATGTIVNTDGSGHPLNPLPTVSITDVSVLEGNSGTTPATFTVKLSAVQDHDTTIHYSTVDGTGAAGATVANNDYVPITNGTVVIPAGSTSATFDVLVNGDTTDELTENFGVNLTSASLAFGGGSALAFTKSKGTGTIINDDLSVNISPATITIGNGAMGNMDFNVALSAVSTHDVTVSFALNDGTAKAGTDYKLPSQLSVTIPAGSAGGKISVPIIGDTLSNAPETFSVQLTGATNAVLDATATATGTINDSNPQPTVSIVPTVSRAEGDTGVSNMVFTVNLSKASRQDVTVHYSTSDGDGTSSPAATGGVDQNAANADYVTKTGTVTIPAGQTQATFAVSIIGDTVNENDEKFSVTLDTPQNATLGAATSVGTILNDDGALTISDVKIAAGSSGTSQATFTVTMSQSPTLPVTVNFSTADGTAAAGTDYVATNGALTFAPGETSKTFTVTINGDPNPDDDETFFANLTNATNATFSKSQGVGTIKNDKTQASIASASITEGDSGTKNLDFAVSLTGAATTHPTTITFAVTDGTAKAGTDYNLPSTLSITIPAGQTTGKISIPIIGNTIFEPTETFQVMLTDATNAVVATGGDTATGTILDNDPQPVISISPVSVAEGNSGLTNAVFKVTLSTASYQDVTVHYATSDGDGTGVATAIGGANQTVAGADYVTKMGTLTILAGQTQGTINVPVIGDTAYSVDEKFTVTLDTPTNATIAPAKTSAVGTILNDDAKPTVSAANVTIAEQDGSLPSSAFTVTLSAASELDSYVNYNTVDGTAKAGQNYQPITGTLHFAPGETSKTVPVLVIDDGIAEPSQTFQLHLTTATNGNVNVGSTDGVATITNNDPLPVLAINDVQIVEGDSGTSNAVFTVTLTGATGQNVTVHYATADGSATSSGPFADYKAISGDLTFALGETTKTISVPVIGDLYKEMDQEVFTVALSSPTNGTLGKGTGTGTIFNGPDSKLAVAVTGGASVEGDSGTANSVIFHVQLSDITPTDLVLHVKTRSGTAVSGADFVAVDKDVTIAANSSSVDVPVSIVGDTVFEATESFFLDVTNIPKTLIAAGADSKGVLHATGTVYNDDKQILPGGKKAQWIDVDGDLVTLTITKGTLTGNMFTFVSAGTVGGSTLQNLDFTGNLAAFQDTSVSIVATKQPGFSGVTDGRVNVGAITAATVLGSELQFVGMDLTNVTVDGDLARITAGDSFSTPAIVKLDVYSLGAHPETTGAADPTSIGAVQSDVLGPIGTVHVATTLNGLLHVIGQEFGTIGTLKVDGAIQGGTTANTGEVFTTGRINSVIVKDILGGAGANTGLILGDQVTGASIGTVKVAGSIIGGTGANSGEINSPRTLGATTIGGNLVGGAGIGSGRIFAGGDMPSFSIKGNIIGGTANTTGGISVTGTLGKLDLHGDLRGGNSLTGTDISLSGFVEVNALGTGKIGGNVVTGTNGGNSLISSGTIRAGYINTLTIAGNVTGTAATPAIISAAAAGGSDLGIKNLEIDGNVSFAEILAGYNDASTAGFRGAATNADAQIGTVSIVGNVTGLNIVAGAAPGADGRFGNATDIVQTGVKNQAKVVSEIASVIIKGNIVANTASYGIVAQFIQSVKVGAAQTPIALKTGPGNDTASGTTDNSVEIATGTLFRAVELPA